MWSAGRTPNLELLNLGGTRYPAKQLGDKVDRSYVGRPSAKEVCGEPQWLGVPTWPTHLRPRFELAPMVSSRSRITCAGCQPSALVKCATPSTHCSCYFRTTQFCKNAQAFVYCQPTAHRFAFFDSPSLRFGQARTDSASLRFVSGMMSSHRGAPDSPLTPGGVESSVSYGRRPLRESLDIRALPPSRRPRPSGERQTGVTGRFAERRAEPTFLADEMSAPADFQVNDAVSEERTSGRSDALSVRSI